MAQRIKTVQESDLRMLGDLARNIQRVLPVTQADIDAAAALGKGWVVTRVFEVSDPLDNMRGGTQLVIRQNSILPRQSVRRVLIVSGPGGQTVVIRGTDYIALPDAIANSLQYVKAFGGTEQRNIPQPYTQVNYVTNTAQTAVNTGVMIDFAKNYEFEVECRAVSGSWYILQSRASASGNVTGIHGETSGSNIKLVVGNVTACTSAITRTVGNKLYVKATLNAGTATLYVKDETANTEDTQTGSYGTTQPNPTAAVYLLGNAGGQYVDVNSDIYMARIKENGVTVMDYVPARQGVTAGFYDTVSGTFKTALTPANLSADGNTVPTPDAPMDIVSNNGVLKLLESATGITTQAGTPTPTNPIPLVSYQNGSLILRSAGEYADSYDATTQNITRRVGVLVLDGTENWEPTSTAGLWLLRNVVATVLPSTCICTHFLGVSTTTSGLDMPDLSIRYGVTGYDNRLYIRHNSLASVGGLKQILADQYAAGTPVTVYYPLAGETTETAGSFVYTDGTVETIRVSGTVPAPGASATVSTDGSSWVDLAVDTATFVAKAEPTGDLTMNFEVTYADAPEDISSVQPNWAGGTATLNVRTTLAKLAESFPKCAFELSQAVFTKTADGWDLDGNLMYYDGSETYTPIDTIHITNLADYGITLGGTAPATDDTMAGDIYCYWPVVESGGSEVSLEQYGVTWAWDSVPAVGDIVTVTYVDGNTATTEMLLKVGDYQDEQEILSGVVTRNVGVLVLDGTENWNWVGTSAWRARLVITTIPVDQRETPPLVCNMFVAHSWNSPVVTQPQISVVSDGTTINFTIGWNTDITTLADWKQYLADQYAAGTPVIIVYPLATPTTESVAGQALQVTGGDNVLEITQASLNGLELEAKYQAAVSLTIQEVQDANLDPNVEVTIN